ncbi:MAG: pilus assembly protein [Alphaproteobacteria bacterium]|nr:pilus assembly protein [Alphaproteobacteria bacterium]
MIKNFKKITGLFATWTTATAGLAAVELALVFPILMMLLVGVFDFGTAFVINQKAISSSQMMADLISRNVTVDADDMANIIDAGDQTMRPYNSVEYGYDIISLRYDGDDADDMEPVVCWRRTAGMEPNDLAIDNADPLAVLGEGLVIVTVSFQYTPLMGARMFNAITMSETAFARGRRSAIVSFQDGMEIGCEDQE